MNRYRLCLCKVGPKLLGAMRQILKQSVCLRQNAENRSPLCHPHHKIPCDRFYPIYGHSFSLAHDFGDRLSSGLCDCLASMTTEGAGSYVVFGCNASGADDAKMASKGAGFGSAIKGHWGQRLNLRHDLPRYQCGRSIFDQSRCNCASRGGGEDSRRGCPHEPRGGDGPHRHGFGYRLANRRAAGRDTNGITQ